MANNLAVKDGTGAAKSLSTIEVSTDIHRPNHGVPDGADIALGATTDAAVTNPASAGSSIALAKGQLTQLSAILAKIISAPATEAKQDAAATLTGAVNETAPASDTASSGLNGRLQRVAQRITSLIGVLPSSLGAKADSLSLSVVTNVLPSGTDRSGTITSGGTAQQLAASNSSRRELRGQNISSGDIWINEIGGTAAADTAGSYRVPSGAAFSVQTNQAISVVGAITGQAWTATEV